MSNLSTYSPPVLIGNASIYGSATSIPVLTLNAKGSAILSTSAFSQNLSTFTNDAGFLVGNASTLNIANTLVQRDTLGGFESSRITLTGVPGAAKGTTAANAHVRIGRADFATSPFVDFRSSGFNNDYDARLIASSGTNGLLGGGNLSFYGQTFYVGAGKNGLTNVNLVLSETAHATSKRASMQVGSWEMGQDSMVSGIKDFYIYNAGIGSHAFIADATTNNVNFSNAVTVATSVYSGIVCGTSRTAAKGNAQLTNGDSTHTGYVEFFPPGTGVRHGWMGYSDGTSLNISAEVGYWNFIGNTPRVSGSAIWHKGNINPLIDNRFAFAGDLTTATLYGNVAGAMYEPYAGACVSGFAVNSSGTITQVRYRYIQKQDSNSNWYTLSYN